MEEELEESNNCLKIKDYCRLCMKKTNDLISVHEPDSEMDLFIKSIFLVTITETDVISKRICQSCMDFCILILEKRLLYRKNNDLLKDSYKKKYLEKPIKFETNIKVESTEILEFNSQYDNEQKTNTQTEIDLLEIRSKYCHISTKKIFKKYKTLLIPKQYWNCDFNPYVDVNSKTPQSWPRFKCKLYENKLRSTRRERRFPKHFAGTIIYALNDIDTLDLYLSNGTIPDFNPPNNATHNRPRMWVLSKKWRERILKNDQIRNGFVNKPLQNVEENFSENHITCTEDKWNKFFEKFITTKNNEIKIKRKYNRRKIKVVKVKQLTGRKRGRPPKKKDQPTVKQEHTNRKIISEQLDNTPNPEPITAPLNEIETNIHDLVVNEQKPDLALIETSLTIKEEYPNISQFTEKSIKCEPMEMSPICKEEPEEYEHNEINYKVYYSKQMSEIELKTESSSNINESENIFADTSHANTNVLKQKNQLEYEVDVGFESMLSFPPGDLLTTHKTKLTFLCQICDKMFMYRKHLDVHMKTHQISELIM